MSAYSALQGRIMTAFKSSDRDIRGAAALALGYLTGGSAESLQSLLDLLDVNTNTALSQPGQVYLHLTALKAALVVGLRYPDVYRDYAADMFAKLRPFVSNTEDGVASIVSESMGRLCVINSLLLSNLSELVESKESESKIVAVNALRNSFSENLDYDALFSLHLPRFMFILEDETVGGMDLKTSFVNAISALVLAKKAKFDRQLVTTIVQQLYKETGKRLDRVEVKDYAGLFKKTTDHHLALRKATYTCLITFMDHLPRFLDLKVFMLSVKVGLNDGLQIQSLVVNLLINLSRTNESIILELLPGLFKLVQKTVVANIKINKEAKNKSPEIVEAARGELNNLIHAVLVFSQLEGAASIGTFTQLVKALTGKLPDMVKANKKALGIE
jgi:hypothetical protein